MRLDNLRPPSGARKKRKRVGRGTGSGHGKTACRGHKGQGSRAGAKSKSWFEGGQMPLQRRVPKRGFTSIFKRTYQLVNLKDLARCEGDVSPETLMRCGLIKKRHQPVKILGNGQLEMTITVKANAFSRSAREKIEAAGGKVEVIE